MKKVLVGALIASVATFGAASIASANVTVVNNNGADVGNVVMVGANTGGNNANGGYAGSAGNGGRVYSSNNNNNGGNGGNAGDGGMGGSIFTGGAVATSLIGNDVNNNDVRVDDCGCEGEGRMIRVRNNNGANVQNGVSVFARTGLNYANGGNAGSAGNGGAVNNSNNDNTGGRGGNAGNGGAGGWIETGVADSLSDIVNIVNRNVVRIR